MAAEALVSAAERSLLLSNFCAAECSALKACEAAKGPQDRGLQDRAFVVALQTLWETQRFSQGHRLLREHFGSLAAAPPHTLLLWLSLALDTEQRREAERLILELLDSCQPGKNAGWTRRQFLALLHLYIFDVLLPELREPAEVMRWVSETRLPLEPDERQSMLDELAAEAAQQQFKARQAAAQQQAQQEGERQRPAPIRAGSAPAALKGSKGSPPELGNGAAAPVKRVTWRESGQDSGSARYHHDGQLGAPPEQGRTSQHDKLSPQPPGTTGARERRRRGRHDPAVAGSQGEVGSCGQAQQLRSPFAADASSSEIQPHQPAYWDVSQGGGTAGSYAEAAVPAVLSPAPVPQLDLLGRCQQQLLRGATAVLCPLLGLSPAQLLQRLGIAQGGQTGADVGPACASKDAPAASSKEQGKGQGAAEQSGANRATQPANLAVTAHLSPEQAAAVTVRQLSRTVLGCVLLYAVYAERAAIKRGVRGARRMLSSGAADLLRMAFSLGVNPMAAVGG